MNCCGQRKPDNLKKRNDHEQENAWRDPSNGHTKVYEQAGKRGNCAASRSAPCLDQSGAFLFVRYVPTPLKNTPNHRSSGTVVSPKLQETNR